jgi:primosomal protein N' (replication factor Y)
MPISVLRVALPAPLPKLFDYLPPAGVAACDCEPGVRLKVPFGRSSKIAVVVGQVDDSAVPAERLRAAEGILDAQPLLTRADLDFLQWTAGYYHHPVGEVVSAALPLRLRKQARALPLAETLYRVSVPQDEALAAVSRAPRQRAVLQLLLDAPGQALSDSQLRAVCEDAGEPLKRLREKGVVVASEAEPVAQPFAPVAAGYPLNEEQQQAVAAVGACLGGFSAWLLEGVTGSGKTEVYLQLAAAALAQDSSVMILVPEISLTPQLQQRFAERLGGTVSVLHSGMGEAERERAWQRVRLGLTRVVLGTRSLVLNPVADLGLIVVDEEHDTSFKQQEGFRYSARDLAVVRAQRAGCPVVLGTATPSLESLRNVQAGRYRHLQLTERAGGAQPPRIDLLDIRDQPLQSGLSEPMLKALARTLEAGEQAMVFLNRRGFAPVLACYSCGWVSDCPRCDARQTVHRHSNLLWCHHCGSQRRVPPVCPECGEADLHPLGQGTEQIEGFLAERFPGVPLIRVDRDATARKGSLDKLLASVHDSEAALLVGTQMLAKGHHFPRVTLVGVMDADGGLFSADFRATERMAQLLMQVAGRAGRGDRPGRVLIQTRYPEHPLLQTLVQHGYDAFAQAALAERDEAEFPPFSYQALLRAEANRPGPPEAFLQQLAEWIQGIADAQVELWGPVPAPMARRVGRFRAHLLIQAAAREQLHPVLSRVQQYLAESKDARKVRWSLDVDPVDTY